MFLLLLIFITGNCWSAEQLRLVFPSNEVKQGALVRARMIVPLTAVNLPLQKLKGQNLSETIYFQQLSPLLRKDGASEYEADTQVIFLSVPQTTTVPGKIGDAEINVNWDQLTVIPTEVPKEMLWADFTAPDVLYKNWMWLVFVAIFLLIPYPAYLLWEKLSFKKNERKRKLALMEEIKSCRSYDDVVALWKKKHSYLPTFPHLDGPFIDLEKTLFKVQFKPVQSESEKAEVMSAYQKFLTETEGGFRGI